MSKHLHVERHDIDTFKKCTVISYGKRITRIASDGNDNMSGLMLTTDISEEIHASENGKAVTRKQDSSSECYNLEKKDKLTICKTMYFQLGGCNLNQNARTCLLDSIHEGMVMFATNHIQRPKEREMESLYGDLEFTPKKIKTKKNCRKERER